MVVSVEAIQLAIPLTTENHMPTVIQESDLLTIAEVMAILRCSRDTVYRYMREYALPFEQFPGRRLVRRDDLQAWRDSIRQHHVEGDDWGGNEA